ncbi:hypothetical protein BGP78_03120 [Pseudoalteromonas sp. MSK9-3]|uniref:hypothetical protein n=1 Tax=Pseudoalteromonas sp. MSK9-3 TaxID=1897633 RepID=UPI000E6BC6F7|nr:hypothetical protein [Pseudoalteromonas sp. MSK9-3]RJE73267.1 hypothetical protein BGP78_03120 [Pseudoalteromonas sp. MSK9-3]
MKDDLDLESLTAAWQSQSANEQLTQTQIKKKILKKRVSLLSITMIELGIIISVTWLLVKAFSESWALYVKAGLFFSFLIGVITFIYMSKSRLNSYRMVHVSTSVKIDYEEKVSLEALKRGKYTKYVIAIFSGMFITSFTYEYFYLGFTMNDLLWRYSFSVAWLMCAWFLNSKVISRNEFFLNKIK